MYSGEKCANEIWAFYRKTTDYDFILKSYIIPINILKRPRRDSWLGMISSFIITYDSIRQNFSLATIDSDPRLTSHISRTVYNIGN